MSRFEILVLGSTGGPFESNLSSYALIDKQHKQALLLDAGTPLTGLQMAYEQGHLSDFFSQSSPFTAPRQFLRDYVKAILISHVHLDHILGLVLCSQIDASKPILALDIMIDLLKEHIFNGKIWPNQGNEGENALSLYHYERLRVKEVRQIADTHMRVEPFLLNHSRTLPSTAFLIECGQEYVLYFGDTSSDIVQTEKRNAIVWKKVAPLIQEKKLKALFLECSFPNSTTTLYGHLNPDLVRQELEHLQKLCGCSLNGLKVIVTHRKQSTRKGEEAMVTVADELCANNNLGIDFVFPKQGARILL